MTHLTYREKALTLSRLRGYPKLTLTECQVGGSAEQWWQFTTNGRKELVMQALAQLETLPANNGAASNP